MEGRRITIAGGGPAGLSAAISLARNGVAVTVHERNRCAGSRFHGDFQGIENWSSDTDALEEFRAAGIQPPPNVPVFGGVAFDYLGRSYSFRSEQPIFYMVRRGRLSGTLDSSLLAQAVEAGVDVRFGSTLPQPSAAAAGPRGANVIAVGYVFETNLRDSAWIAFDDDLAPAGYAYLLVHGGQGTVATTLFRDFSRQAKYLERTVGFFRRKTGVELRHPRRFGGYGRFGIPELSGCLLGEQAGLQDPLAGFGIRYAVRSGLLYARSVVEGVDYAELVERELAPLVRAGLANRWLVEHFGDRVWRWVLRKLRAGADPRVELGAIYRPSLRTRILAPVAEREWQPARAKAAVAGVKQ